MLGSLHDKEIEEILSRNVLGRLGCTDGNTVYVVPVNYVYEGGHILCHSLDGMKITMMRKNPQVCFEVEEMENMMNWRSVIAWGSYEELTDELEKEKALDLLVEKMLKLKAGETALPPHATDKRSRPHAPGNYHVVVWRIAILKKTGRFEKN